MDAYRETVLNALDVYSSENTILLFKKVVRLLGFPAPAAIRDSIDKIVESANDVPVVMHDIPLTLNSQKLYPSVRSVIAACKDKPSELEFFISDVIGKFSGLSRYVYPMAAHGGYSTQLAALTIYNTTQHYNPPTSVLNEWRKYELRLNSGVPEWALNKAVEYRLDLYHSFMGTQYHTYASAIIDAMRYVAGLIDAALLECDCDKDFFYFQKKAGSVLTYELDAVDLYTSSGVNSVRIKKKWFDRSFYYDVAPSGLLLPDFRDEIAEYRSTGVWNMTRSLYISIIAAPDDIRRSNLNHYLSCYRSHVYLLNEDQSIRELCPVFYDLYELWGEISFFIKNDTFAPYPCRDYVKILRQAFVEHLAFAYYVYLINSKTSWFDIYTLCPGIKKDDIESYLCDETSIMSHDDFVAHEKELPSLGRRYEPFPGYYAKEKTLAKSRIPAASETTDAASRGEKEYKELTIAMDGKQETVRELNYVELCGVWEIDHLFILNPKFRRIFFAKISKPLIKKPL